MLQFALGKLLKIAVQAVLRPVLLPVPQYNQMLQAFYGCLIMPFHVAPVVKQNFGLAVENIIAGAHYNYLFVFSYHCYYLYINAIDLILLFVEKIFLHTFNLNNCFLVLYLCN